MGLFNRGKQNCDICGNTIGFGKVKCLDGVICGECQFKQHKISKCQLTNNLTLKEVKEYIDFNPTKNIDKYLLINESEKKWIAPLGISNGKKNPTIYNFSDISSYELIEDDEVILKSGGLGRALVGGALFGGAGAIIGGITAKRKSKKQINKLYIKITLNDFNNPVIIIKIIDKPTSYLLYKSVFNMAQELLSSIEIMVKSSSNSKQIEKVIEAIYCKKCGNKLDINSVFCNKCGEKL
ncbi:TPA: SHOCT domain-containing protein [Clostridium perfringens]